MYKQLLPQMGGYITYAGELDRNRLEMLLARLGAMELEVLEERAKVGQAPSTASAALASQVPLQSSHQACGLGLVDSRVGALVYWHWGSSEHFGKTSPLGLLLPALNSGMLFSSTAALSPL